MTVFTGCDERTAYTTYHHNECGKFWTEKSDDHLPNYCPGCGEGLTGFRGWIGPMIQLTAFQFASVVLVMLIFVAWGLMMSRTADRYKRLSGKARRQ